MFSLYKTILLLLFITTTVISESTIDNGFGEKYDWVPSLEEGLSKAMETNKPIMLVIHKSWCGACKSLKPKFAESQEILDLSEHFIMVNLMDDDEPTQGRYAPDGAYIPRILFMKPDGEVVTDIYNEVGSEKHKYFYAKPSVIVPSMKKMLKLHSATAEENEEL